MGAWPGAGNCLPREPHLGTHRSWGSDLLHRRAAALPTGGEGSGGSGPSSWLLGYWAVPAPGQGADVGLMGHGAASAGSVLLRGALNRAPVLANQFWGRSAAWLHCKSTLPG